MKNRYKKVSSVTGLFIMSFLLITTCLNAIQNYRHLDVTNKRVVAEVDSIVNSKAIATTLYGVEENVTFNVKWEAQSDNLEVISPGRILVKRPGLGIVRITLTASLYTDMYIVGSDDPEIDGIHSLEED